MFKVLVANTPIAQVTAWHAFVVSGNLLQLVCELVTGVNARLDSEGSLERGRRVDKKLSMIRGNGIDCKNLETWMTRAKNTGPTRCDVPLGAGSC